MIDFPDRIIFDKTTNGGEQEFIKVDKDYFDFCPLHKKLNSAIIYNRDVHCRHRKDQPYDPDNIEYNLIFFDQNKEYYISTDVDKELREKYVKQLAE